jgi:Protein of unknown function (DUF3352)
VSDALAGPEPPSSSPEPAAAGPAAASPGPPPHRHVSRRLILALAGAALLVLAVLIIALAARSSAPQGAAQVVPADALGFVDLSLEANGAGLSRGLGLAEHFPDFGRLSGSVEGRIGAVLSGGRGVDLATQVLPWVGREAALALLNTTTATAGSLIILEVRHAVQARAFIDGKGATPRGSYRGTPLFTYSSGSELAFVSHFLIVGQDASVRAAVDVVSGGAPSLAGSSVYQRAIAPEPATRLVTAYASLAGVRRLLSPRGGVVGALGNLLYQPSLQGVAVGVVPAPGGAQVVIHSALDPTLQRLGGAHATFTPTLQNVLPAGSILMLDVRGLNRAAPAVLSAGATAGIAGGIGSLLSRLGGALGAEGVDVHAVTSLFSGETAVGVVPNGGSQTLVVVARVSRPTQARTELAQLEIPLSQLFQTPNATKVPEFNDLTVDGVSDHQLALANGLELDYAVFDGLVVISTSTAGVADVAGVVARHSHSLAEAPGFRSVLASRPVQLTSLIYMALPDLVTLGRSTELISGAGFQRLAPDLAAISDAGLTTTRSDGQSSVQIHLRVPSAAP